ncbi:MAG: sugar phosphate nucleotidyltransferase [Candidatus Kapabacteria bacterium]|nr:sugar phosphate nucleotidyltransferase [Candidatus Kapabacteria bacterium]MCS7169697.1 sugar phosphate nucleotidyltransferase [Candidatus Kapabacteria bacterium]MDW7996608.1 sugar phosphate nucleotidyltransferase [Bacteroidota bacterium]MDW8225491.1 sugar phosphate nucleotidyltransferase [Bacteroidota bacterium]
MEAVILAGGLGERLRPLTKIIPKPLLPVGERSVLEITLLGLKRSGVRRIFVALNYQSELFKAFLGDGSRWGLQIECSVEDRPLGTAGPLRLFADRLRRSFVVINGDILTNLNFRSLLQYHRHHRALATVVTKQLTLPLRYGVVTAKEGYIQRLEEKPNVHAEVVAGIYACEPEVLQHIPPQEYYTMPQLIHRLLDMGQPVAQFPLRDYWLDIGQMEDYERAQQLYAQGAFDELVGDAT